MVSTLIRVFLLKTVTSLSSPKESSLSNEEALRALITLLVLLNTSLLAIVSSSTYVTLPVVNCRPILV